MLFKLIEFLISLPFIIYNMSKLANKLRPIVLQEGPKNRVAISPLRKRQYAFRFVFTPKKQRFDNRSFNNGDATVNYLSRIRRYLTKETKRQQNQELFTFKPGQKWG